MKNIFLTFSILFLFFLMISFPSITKDAAVYGLNLWLFTIMPTLLPYTIISSLILYLNLPFSKFLYIFISIMSGCPIGAKLSADLYENKKLDKKNAQFIMCAFNNFSPSFILNYLCSDILFIVHNVEKWCLFILINICSLAGALTLYFITEYPINGMQKDKVSQTAVSVAVFDTSKNKQNPPIDKCILSAFEIQAKIGGYIILFNIATSLFKYTLNLSDTLSAALGSFFEITGGLSLFANHPPQQVPLILFFVSFGGICTIFQTITVISHTDLSVIKYIFSKFLAGIYSFLLFNFIY